MPFQGRYNPIFDVDQTRKLCGANDYHLAHADANGNLVYSGTWFFQNWASLWESTIKPRIRKIKEFGFNCLRYTGHIGCVVGGYVNGDVKRKYYKQYLDECKRMGLYVEWICSIWGEMFGDDPNTSAYAMYTPERFALFISELKKDVAWLESYARNNGVLISIDLNNEARSLPLFEYSASPTLITDGTFVTTLYNECKPLTKLPITFSSDAFDNNNTLETTIANLVDFHSWHIYDLAKFSTTLIESKRKGKPVLISEFAATGYAVKTLAEAKTWIQTALPQVQNNPSISGGMYFQIADHNYIAPSKALFAIIETGRPGYPSYIDSAFPGMYTYQFTAPRNEIIEPLTGWKNQNQGLVFKRIPDKNKRIGLVKAMV